MALRKYLVKTPELSEYIFNILVNTPKDVVSNLSTQEMAYFKDVKAMRRFADNESLEKTLQLLARIDIPFFVAFGERNTLAITFEEIGTQWQSVEKRKSLIDAMSRNKLFAFCSNDVLLYGHMAAQNSHSRVYVLNPMYAKLHQKILDAGRMPINTEFKDSTDAFDMMARAALQSILKIDHTQSMAGVSDYEMKILLAMFEYRSTFITAAKICEILEEGKRVGGVAIICRHMITKGLIKPLSNKDKNNHNILSYTIAERGLSAVMPFLSHISKKAYYG